MSSETDSRIITSLDHDSLLSIVVELCKDAGVLESVLAMAKAKLCDIDSEAISAQVFSCLNAIDVVVLWESSGESYYGYREPTEVALEMLEDEVSPFRQEAIKLHNLNFHDEEKMYCAAIVRGILRYAEEGNDEFRTWVPDDHYVVAKNIIDEWSKRNPNGDSVAFKEEFGF